MGNAAMLADIQYRPVQRLRSAEGALSWYPAMYTRRPRLPGDRYTGVECAVSFFLLADTV